MPGYYVNRNPQHNGDHEVHKSTCLFLPDPENRTFLGEHSSCHSAIAAARRYFNKVDGCYYCSPDCHRS